MSGHAAGNGASGAAHDRLCVDVAVVGRGAVGAAAALAAARAGWSTALIGRHGTAQASTPVDPWDLRVFALSPLARTLLDSIGVWPLLDAARVAPVHDMRVWPVFASRADELHFSAYESCIDALAWIVEQRNLMQALERALGATPVQIIDAGFASFASFSGSAFAGSGSRPSLPATEDPGAPAQPSRSPSGVRELLLDDGRRVEARLVIGADGALSPVRAAAGIRHTLSEYPQRALVAHFDTALSHRDGAYQWFGEDGILALLPLPAEPRGYAPLSADGGRSRAHPDSASAGTAAPAKARRVSSPVGRVSIVWSAPGALADELQALAPEDLAARVERASGSLLGAMTPISRVQQFPLRLIRVSSMTAGRVALAGDAAHVVHPLAGQGMNLGFGDVAELARILGARDAVDDPGDGRFLHRYERRRAEPVAAMRFTTDALQRLFDHHHPPVPAPLDRLARAAVRTGWRVVAHSHLMRTLLIGRAVR